MVVTPPTPTAIAAAHEALRGLARTTPTIDWDTPALRHRLGAGTRVTLKLEQLQHTGSFKVRGAFTVMGALTAEQLRRGVTAASAGNHAMAVAHAAARLGTHAKVAMPGTADPMRIERTRALGAEVVLCQDIAAAFAEAQRVADEEGRTFVHPFEGPGIALGTATLGREFHLQAPDLDALVVPVGGGGLAAGVAAAVKQLAPHVEIHGVEPLGADSMTRSLAAGTPQRIDRVATIADSLGSPTALPHSFALCQRFLDDIVQVSDDDLCEAMALHFTESKLLVEPAGAATAAALLGPLRERLAGRHVGLIVCGANVAPPLHAQYVARGMARLRAQT